MLMGMLIVRPLWHAICVIIMEQGTGILCNPHF